VNFKISYAITVCNEHKELKSCLEFISQRKRKQDEIVVQIDSDNHTDKVLKVIKSFNLTINKFKLNNNFAKFKNNLKKICKGDYIFQIDADEIPSEEIVLNLHEIIKSNLDIDLFLVPRINIVKGFTPEDLNEFGWTQNSKKWINFPDYQYRIFKNTFYIKWKNKVHEQIVGATSGSKLPPTEEYALMHIKNSDKQRSQNSLYEKINK
jgi:glycosyltransferase involved in cell wall biosynthesis